MCPGDLSTSVGDGGNAVFQSGVYTFAFQSRFIEGWELGFRVEKTPGFPRQGAELTGLPSFFF